MKRNEKGQQQKKKKMKNLIVHKKKSNPIRLSLHHFKMNRENVPEYANLKKPEYMIAAKIALKANTYFRLLFEKKSL